MSLTMKDVTTVLDALNEFHYECGPNGVLLLAPAPRPPNGGPAYKSRPDERIQAIGGIGRPGEWHIVEVPTGEAFTGSLTTKRALRTALLERLATHDFGPKPPNRHGYTIYAHSNPQRASVIWSYRKISAPSIRQRMNRLRSRRS